MQDVCISFWRDDGGSDMMLKVTDICSIDPNDPSYCATPADIKIDRAKCSIMQGLPGDNFKAVPQLASYGFPGKTWWFFTKCWADVKSAQFPPGCNSKLIHHDRVSRNPPTKAQLRTGSPPLHSRITRTGPSRPSTTNGPTTMPHIHQKAGQHIQTEHMTQNETITPRHRSRTGFRAKNRNGVQSLAAGDGAIRILAVAKELKLQIFRIRRAGLHNRILREACLLRLRLRHISGALRVRPLSKVLYAQASWLTLIV